MPYHHVTWHDITSHHITSPHHMSLTQCLEAMNALGASINAAQGAYIKRSLLYCLFHISVRLCLWIMCFFSHTTSHRITSHHIISHHITSHRITPHHITSHHITSHHITSHHITSHHITHFSFSGLGGNEISLLPRGLFNEAELKSLEVLYVLIFQHLVKLR